MKRAKRGRSAKRYIGQLGFSVLWPAVIPLAVAQGYYQQDHYQGYRFAPAVPGEAGGMTYGYDAQPGPDATWGDSAPALTGPGGRPYRFRNGTGYPPRAEQQTIFRPDTRLGQQPKNWSADPGWASDPVLQRGLVFRPLPKKDSDVRRSDQKGRAAAPPEPAYGYRSELGWGGYPGYYWPVDPGLAVPGWSFPGGLGGWTPGW